MESRWKKHEYFSKNREEVNFQVHRSNADNGKSSPLTSLPQRELSEGFENVNFLKNDKR